MVSYSTLTILKENKILEDLELTSSKETTVFPQQSLNISF